MKQLKHSKIFYLLSLGILSFLFLFAAGCQETRPTYIDAVTPIPSNTGATATGPLHTPEPSTASASAVTSSPVTHTPSAVKTPTATKITNDSPTAALVPTVTSSPGATAQPTETPIQIDFDFTPMPQKPDPSKPMIALTFDDGPNASVTNRILDILEQYNAKATFFVVGNRLDSAKNQAALSRALSLGCEIGSHTYEHARLTKLSAEEIQEQISKTDQALIRITGSPAPMVRPPYGAINDTVRNIVQAPLILWSIDTEDWKSKNAYAVYNATISIIKDGDIVLMHDLYSTTADACELVIPTLLSKGYQLVTVSELFESKGLALVNGTSYRKTY